ncbi:MAG: HAD family phosphatase [Chthonomonadales bacterium]|nr:HAD family phosphatase [Chthonomonadales bacterium]
MTPPRYRILFVDIDGTLVGDSDDPSARAFAALERAGRAGCRVVLCTGRSRHTTRRLAARLGGSHGVLLNGAVIVEWSSGMVLRKTALDPGVVSRAIEVVRAHGMAPLCFGTRDDDRWIVTDGRAPVHPGYARHNADRLVWRDDVSVDLEDLPTMVAAYGPPARGRAVAEAARRALGRSVRVIESVSPRYDCWCTEIHSPEADKALAAAALAERLGVAASECAAIGDHLNDISLLRWAGLGVAMGDGHPDARACADRVTGCLADDGLASAVERYVLGDGH